MESGKNAQQNEQNMIVDANILEELRGFGFTVEQREIMSYSLADLGNDRLRFLADYPLMGFRFVRFHDEMLVVKSEKLSGNLFGQTWYGPVIWSNDGTVHLFSTETPNIFPHKTVMVNSRFDDFVRCYSLYISALYELRAQFDDLQNAAIHLAEVFLEKATRIDPDAARDFSFWGQYAFLLEELHAVFAVPWADYIKTGRLSNV